MLLALNCSVATAQWAQYCYFPVSQPTFGSASFIDAEFISVDTGVYLSGHAVSHESGFNALYTSDGANSWTGSFADGGFGVSAMSVATVKRQSTFYILTSYGGFTQLKKSDDGGASWNTVGGLGFECYRFFPCDTSKFYAARYQSGATHLTKYDHGIFNYSLATIPSHYPTDLFFPDTTNGYIMTSNASLWDSHFISKTVDGGVSWVNVLNDSSIYLTKMFFTTANNGYTIGRGGKMLRTQDGGASWQNVQTGTNFDLLSLYFLNDSTGFVAGDSGTIIRTNDFGMTWTQDFTGTTGPFSKIFFVNDSIGFALSGQRMYSINLNRPTGLLEPNIVTYSSLKVFPNPAAGKFNVLIPSDLLNEKHLLLSIYDTMGKRIQEQTLETHDGELSLHLEAAGIYNIVLTKNNTRFSGKVIIE